MALPFLVPFLGPWLLRLAPILARVPTLDSIKRWLRIGSYLAVLGVGTWLGAAVLSWWQGELISQREAAAKGKAQCASTIALATLQSREKAVAERESALLLRETAVAQDAKEIADFEKQLEADRANSKNDSAAALGADDGWLQNWARRR